MAVRQQEQQTTETRRVEAALEYANRGWKVLPLHSVDDDGQCSCGNRDCSSSGKHPRTGNGFKDATTDPEQIKKWWAQWPNANIGIETGEDSGFVVLDVDGQEGEESLELDGEPLPDSPTVATGNGRHFYFAHPGHPVKNFTRGLPGIDLRGDGGYVVAPPSRHESGDTYRWEIHPDDVDLPELPEWIEGLTQESTSTHGDVEGVGVIPEGRRNDTLTGIAGYIRRKGLTEDQLKRALSQVNGDACNPPLPRDEVESIAASIAEYPPEDVPSRLTADINDASDANDASVEVSAAFDGLVDLVSHRGQVRFLVMEGDGASIRRRVERGGETLVPPAKGQLPWLLPDGEAVLEAVASDSDEQLFDDLVERLSRVSKLPSDDYWKFLLAPWVIHTYFLDRADYSPQLLLYAVPERGKTRTGKALTYCAYRGVRMQTVREAHLIRLASHHRATLFLDSRDLWKKASSEGTGDLLLFRFERDGKAMRVHRPGEGPFRDTDWYDSFGPTIFATNKRIDKILGTRCVPILMPEAGHMSFEENVKKKNYVDLRERLVAAAARHADREWPTVDKPVASRLADILRPLRQVVRVMRPDLEEGFVEFAERLACERRAEKAASFEAKVIGSIQEIVKDDKADSVPGEPKTYWFATQDVARVLAGPPVAGEEKAMAQKVGQTLRELGLARKRTSDQRGWKITLDQLEKLRVKYGLPEEPSLASSASQAA